MSHDTYLADVATCQIYEIHQQKFLRHFLIVYLEEFFLALFLLMAK